MNDTIHTWWKGLPGERFWLDVTERNDRDTLLAAPRGEGPASTSWMNRLISHVQGGDVVFHYDSQQQAIVAWSLSHGRVEKQRLAWPLPPESPGTPATSRLLPSWGIRLRQFSPLVTPVHLDEIARVQWRLFPMLRTLEDEVGDPLYYPFEIGNRLATRALTGYVFKLPSMVVHEIPALSGAVDRISWAPDAPEGNRTREDDRVHETSSPQLSATSR